jgi:hypothetical protein
MSSREASVAPAVEQTAFEIGVEGYTFLYPLVLMDLTRRQMTNVEKVGDVPLRGPMDAFVHVPAFPPASFRDVVRPNFDTLYSVAWLDLSEEPRVVSVPAAGDLYYLLPLYDMWTEVFASPGTRTTGNGALDAAVCPPGFAGDLPDGMRVYEAPTPTAWVIGRTQASVATYDRVHAFQAGMTIRRLSEWGGTPSAVTGAVDATVDPTTPPMRQAFALDAARFFASAAELLAVHPPHQSDYPVLDRLEQVGFRRGTPFDLAAVDPVVREALERAVPVAQKRISEAQASFGRHVNGWAINLDVFGAYGVEYLKRATVALGGLGANLSADAVYPFGLTDADGESFDGSRRYVWHLDADELPPVKAFWSLTMYDTEGFPVANEIDRCAIGDRDDLQYNADGSLDIHLESRRPETRTSNWLPAPEGAFTVVARLYWPEPEVLDGRWTPPPITKVR